MSTKNKSIIPSTNTPTDFRMAHIKSAHTRNFNRSNISPIPKSSLSHPTTITRPTISHHSNNQQQNTRYLYVVNTPIPSYRTISTRIPNHHSNTVSPQQQQQQQQQPVPPRPFTQYGHFLAYLRRQSLARTRRKQQQEEGNLDYVETTIRLNLNKQSSTQSITDRSSTPMISMTAKRTERLPSSYRSVQRSITSYRINTFRQTPPILSKDSIDDQLITLTSSSLLITPRNSIDDDTTVSPIINPYELHLNNDKHKYGYVNDDHGQILSTAV